MNREGSLTDWLLFTRPQPFDDRGAVQAPGSPDWIVLEADCGTPTAHICKTEMQRDVVTMLSIFGELPVPDEHAEEAAAVLAKLREEREITFEDGWVKWIEAYLANAESSDSRP